MSEKISPLRVAFWGACPRCGEGRLFSGYLRVAHRCNLCGLDLEKEDSGDGPAFILIFVLGFLLGPPIVLVELAYAPPLWLHLALWPLATLILTLAALRPLKALLIALQYRYHASDSGKRDYDEE